MTTVELRIKCAEHFPCSYDRMTVNQSETEPATKIAQHVVTKQLATDMPTIKHLLSGHATVVEHRTIEGHL